MRCKACALFILFLFLASASVCIFIPSVQAREKVCYYGGPDDSDAGLELTDFIVYAPYYPVEFNDTVNVSFTVTNINKTHNISFYSFGVYVEAVDPNGDYADFAHTYGYEELGPGESVDVEGRKKLNISGRWKFWPAFESDQGYSPEEWHLCTVNISGEDTSPPEVNLTHSPQNPTSEDEITFTASAEDPSGIDIITLYVNAEIVKECSGSPCTYTAGPYPDYEGSYVSYAADVYDASKNENRAWTDYEYIEISEAPTDEQAPNVDIVYSPEEPTSEDEITFTATAEDETELLNLQILVDAAVAAECETSPCTYTAGPYPDREGERISYNAIAYDTSDNRNSTGYRFLTVSSSDQEPPTLEVSHSPEEPTRVDEITFTATAEDPSGIEDIQIYVNAEQVAQCNTSPCTYTGGPYPEFYRGVGISYAAEATDTEGNRKWLDYQNVDISSEDKTPPNVVIEPSTPSPAYTQEVRYTARAVDRNGIDKVEIYINADKVKECQGTPCTYTGGPYEEDSSISYMAVAYDNFENQGTTGYQSFRVRAPKLKLLFVPVEWWLPQRLFEQEIEDQVDVFINQVPLKNCRSEVEIEILSVAENNFDNFTCNENDCNVDSIREYVIGLGIDPSEYTSIIGLLPDSPCEPIMGCSNGADTVWLTDEYGTVLAHELGHNYGLEDEYCSNVAGSTDSRCNDGGPPEGGSDINYLDEEDPLDCPPDGSDDSTGSACCNFQMHCDRRRGCYYGRVKVADQGDDYEIRCDNTSYREMGVVHRNYGPCCLGNKNSEGGRAIMSFADVHEISPGPRVFDEHSSYHLNRHPQLTCEYSPIQILDIPVIRGTSATGMVSAGENTTSDTGPRVIDINLDIYQDGTVEEDSIVLTNGTPTLTYRNLGGDYRAEILTQTDKKIWNISFHLNFGYDGPVKLEEDYSNINYTSRSFSYRVPYHSTMKELVLYHNDEKIYSKELNFCNRNGICEQPETYSTCPGDCPLSSEDRICLPEKDGTCDPDCNPGVDPDCPAQKEVPAEGLTPGQILLAVLVILIPAGLLFYRYRSRILKN